MTLGDRDLNARHIQLVAALPEHWPAIRDLLLARGLPLDGAQDHLANFLVVQQEMHIVATAGVEVYGQVGLLRSVAVDPCVEGQGIGTRLTLAAQDRASHLGLLELYLLTTTAKGFFERYGFETVPREKLPKALGASREFQGACPATATAMVLRVQQRTGRK